MRRIAVATAAAFCIGGGFVLGEFVRGVRPVGYLTRPLLAVVVLAVVVGVASSLFQQWAVIAAVFVVAWIVQPGSTIALVVAGVTAGLLAYRLWKRRTPNMDTALLAAAGVFLAAGLVPVVPMMSWSTPARADVPTDGPPQYVILLDGYPRADTLAELGVDSSDFIGELETRGFNHYSDATSHHAWTFRTLTLMTTGEPMSSDDWGTPSERKAARESWRLPDGFTYIAPPSGMVTFPNVSPMNAGGLTHFEAGLLADSAVGHLSSDLVMDGLRDQLNRSLGLLASTSNPRVFAHLLAPHTPFLYDGDAPLGAPSCWPDCDVFEINAAAQGLTVDEWGDRTAGYLEWLNRRLIETIDAVLGRYPDARIVLFSDHGGRFSYDWPEEWHRTFLAARGVDLSESPHPAAILPAVQKP